MLQEEKMLFFSDHKHFSLCKALIGSIYTKITINRKANGELLISLTNGSGKILLYPLGSKQNRCYYPLPVFVHTHMACVCVSERLLSSIAQDQIAEALSYICEYMETCYFQIKCCSHLARGFCVYCGYGMFPSHSLSLFPFLCLSVTQKLTTMTYFPYQRTVFAAEKTYLFNHGLHLPGQDIVMKIELQDEFYSFLAKDTFHFSHALLTKRKFELFQLYFHHCYCTRNKIINRQYSSLVNQRELTLNISLNLCNPVTNLQMVLNLADTKFNK